MNDLVFTPQRWKQILDLSATLPTPHIIIDTDVIERKYKELKRNFPQAVIHYAVKANPNERLSESLPSLDRTLISPAAMSWTLCCILE